MEDAGGKHGRTPRGETSDALAAGHCDHRIGGHNDHALRYARFGGGYCQDRADCADDRRPGLDRQAARQCGQALHSATRRCGRGQEDRSHSEGRRRQPRKHQASRPGADRQRKGGHHRRLRHHAGGAGRGAAGDPGKGSGDCHAGRHLDHHRALTLYRAYQLHAGAIVHHHWRLGRQGRHQEGSNADVRLRPGQRRAAILQERFYGRREARSSRKSKCRWPIPISRHSCSA